MQLAAAALAALWSLYDATGIRPEWVLPTLWIESGFDPSVQNAQGAPYYGIGQTSAGDIAALGSTPADFLTWSQADQLTRAVGPYFTRLVASYGPLRSGVRVYQANFQPATLQRVRALFQVVAWRGSPAYEYNRGLDALRDGAITMSDLGIVVERAARRPEVMAAIAAAYVLRPDETPTNPTLGAEYTDPLWWLLAPAAVGAYSLGNR
jgi:hypothetical protein